MLSDTEQWEHDEQRMMEQEIEKLREKNQNLFNALMAATGKNDELIAALGRAGFAVVPVELPHDVLGRAAIAGVAETGNPKHAWDFLIAATRAA